MELWVRSQDRESLMKVNRVDKYGLSIVTFDNECREIYLGRYATEKRALEVLDEIQTQIATLNYQYLHRGTNFIVTESNVYEMPKE